MKRLISFGVCALALTSILVTGFAWAGPPKKVTLCHNGNVISVAPSAVPAHKAHGDCLTKGNPGDKCTCCFPSGRRGEECRGTCFNDNLTCQRVPGSRLCDCIDANGIASSDCGG